MSEKGAGGRATYREAGVDTAQAEAGIDRIKTQVEETFSFCPEARVCLPLGYFCNVVDIGQGMGIAISTDSVGTKILIADTMKKYDTIGIDCVAMNANDVLCVGARPVAMVDYVAVQKISPAFMESLGKGLIEGARMAGISIPGGEIAQIRELLRGVHEDSGFDIVGTCIGTVRTDRINTGNDVRPGDVVVGLRSSGIHSNGFTLARSALLDRGGLSLGETVASLGRTLGEELLEPTRIYVKEVWEVLGAGIDVKAMAHITGDGFMNLNRVGAPVGFVLDTLPEPQPIFDLIQELGDVADEEMYTVFNMGVGFCLVVGPDDVDRTLAILQGANAQAIVIGRATEDAGKRVVLAKQGLVGSGNQFERIAQSSGGAL